MGGNENMGLDVRRVIGVQFECELFGLVHIGYNQLDHMVRPLASNSTHGVFCCSVELCDVK